MQIELNQPGSLLTPDGRLRRLAGHGSPCWIATWKPHISILCGHFNDFRIKRWDYYAVFTPKGFFSATIADLGYAGNLFVYVMDFETGELHEEGFVIPIWERYPASTQQHRRN